MFLKREPIFWELYKSFIEKIFSISERGRFKTPLGEVPAEGIRAGKLGKGGYGAAVLPGVAGCERGSETGPGFEADVESGSSPRTLSGPILSVGASSGRG